MDLIDLNPPKEPLITQKPIDKLITLTLPEKNDTNEEMKKIYKLTIEDILIKNKEDINKISPDSNIYNIDMVLHYLYLNHLLKINRAINNKFLDILVTRINVAELTQKNPLITI